MVSSQGSGKFWRPQKFLTFELILIHKYFLIKIKITHEILSLEIPRSRRIPGIRNILSLRIFIPGIRNYFLSLGIFIPRFRDIWVSGFLFPEFEIIFLVSGFLSPGFGIFIPGIRNYFSSLGIFIPGIRDFLSLGIFIPGIRNYFSSLGIFIPGIRDFSSLRILIFGTRNFNPRDSGFLFPEFFTWGISREFFILGIGIFFVRWGIRDTVSEVPYPDQNSGSK